MHADEVEIDQSLVRQLLAAQFPQWRDLPIQLVLPRGTDHAIFRLGDDLSARMPRINGRLQSGSKELDWLPRLAPALPVAVPIPVAEGRPGAAEQPNPLPRSRRLAQTRAVLARCRQRTWALSKARPRNSHTGSFPQIRAN